MKKIKTGDEVIFLTGKDKGKVGKVLRVLADRVVIEGLNKVKKHVKPNPNKSIEGGIVSQEMPVHISNVAIYNTETKKMDRIGVKNLENGERARFFKSNGSLIKV